ncbi:MAG: 16S rRNA (adenine(1518)-N(6)/adenine(1519)-N(6))-dimethyltransferase RsmA [Tissierellia bacterium]|nr:16S rRNA (adenine(1518)-N(6)/adenine(1519)-N(6))-dimethyltransferase RsmA [Tissierellia bacterium]
MNRIYHPSRTREILEQWNLMLKKSLGQNFLIDGNILENIAMEGEVGPGDVILEVGPGIGSLTEELLLRGAYVRSIELDQRLYPVLEENLSSFERFQLIRGDATEKEIFEMGALGDGHMAQKFIANLPYVVTAPLLERIFMSEAPFQRAVIMVQREVAKRMIAKPGDAEYSSLSVFVSYCSKAREAFTVKAGSFFPRPKVESTVVVLDTIQKPTHVGEFMKVVHGAFGMRRKTVLNALSMGLDMAKDNVQSILEEAEISPSARAEELGLEDFQRLYEKMTKEGSCYDSGIF